VPDRHRPTPGPHLARRCALAVIAVGLVTSACSHDPSSARPPSSHFTSPSPTPTPHAAASAGSTSGPATGARSTGSRASGAARGASAKPLAGEVVGIDPGHNGGNANDPGYINSVIWNGREQETCDTTGTETDAGYTEAVFNFTVATFLRADLRRDGARVVMTRTSNNGVGPCVTSRAEIINRARADVAIDLHADGGPASGRGFAILEPVADGPNDNVITSSVAFGHDLRSAFLAGTSMPVSTYDGINGLVFRDDLAGLNLTRVPKVLIECGNMRNATDASLLTSTRFQRRAARAIEAAIIGFLRGR
jgi:N-acetylmuramoyl-L-alanine amidase